MHHYATPCTKLFPHAEPEGALQVPVTCKRNAPSILAMRVAVMGGSVWEEWRLFLQLDHPAHSPPVA